MEKGNYASEEARVSPTLDAPPYDDKMTAEKERMGEAADIYGDIETAEEYGYVTRGLKSRHIQFIALGGTIGTGLFLGIGRALTQAGPLSILLGYTFTGIAVFGMVSFFLRAPSFATFITTKTNAWR
jgi:amino acid transporter